MAGGDLVASAIQAAANAWHVSVSYLSRVAQIESSSGTDRTAYDASGAQGLFQFTTATANDYHLTNPLDDAANAMAAAQLTAHNSGLLTAALGRAPSGGELYLAHQQGISGALALLAHPTSLASELVGIQAVLQNGGNVGDTAAQFSQHVEDLFGDTDSGSAAVPAGGVGQAGSAAAIQFSAGGISVSPQASATASNWFYRGVIIALGMIFVAVGLSMFRGPSTIVQTIAKAVPK